MLAKTLIVLGILLGAFIWWRLRSVRRGKDAVDETILARLEELADRLERRQPVPASEVERLAHPPENRPLLFQLLHHYDRTDLFPASLVTPQEQGKGLLAYWMMHPNELQNPPIAIEWVATCPRTLVGHTAEFFVYRHRMPDRHWAGPDWILGISGPFFLHRDRPPYLSEASGFSRAGDLMGKVQPDELADWYVGMLERKFGSGG